MGIVLGIIGIVMMVYFLSLLGESDYLITRGGFIIGFFVMVVGGVIALLPYKIKF